MKAPIAYMEMLNAIRSSGRRPATSVIAMLDAASGTANRQPKRIATVTVKMFATETSDLPPSCIGIGRRSARSASAKKRTTLAAVFTDGGSSTIDPRASRISGAATATVAPINRKSLLGRPQISSGSVKGLSVGVKDA